MSDYRAQLQEQLDAVNALILERLGNGRGVYKHSAQNYSIEKASLDELRTLARELRTEIAELDGFGLATNYGSISYD